MTIKATGQCLVLEARSREAIFRQLDAGTFPEPTIQAAYRSVDRSVNRSVDRSADPAADREPNHNAPQAQPERLHCTFVQNLTLTQAQAEIAPELALWPKNSMTAQLPYTKPTYADIRAAAGDLFIPPDDLWLEMQAGKSLTEAVKPTPRYDPLNPVRFDAHTYATLFDFARTYRLQAHRLYWIHDRRLITPERIRLLTT